uniref:Uncharacterized protein n=1 Tax=Arundo donax TaxID=35708 RepID=A0A0A9ENQ9_ARUDO
MVAGAETQPSSRRRLSHRSLHRRSSPGPCSHMGWAILSQCHHRQIRHPLCRPGHPAAAAWSFCVMICSPLNQINLDPRHPVSSQPRSLSPDQPNLARLSRARPSPLSTPFRCSASSTLSVADVLKAIVLAEGRRRCHAAAAVHDHGVCRSGFPTSPTCCSSRPSISPLSCECSSTT